MSSDRPLLPAVASQIPMLGVKHSLLLRAYRGMGVIPSGESTLRPGPGDD